MFFPEQMCAMPAKVNRLIQADLSVVLELLRK
jgi:hypothetical protein